MRFALIIILLVVSSALKAQQVHISPKGSSNTTTSSKHYDTHVVAQGETLYSVSKKYHTTVDALLKMNPDIVNNNLQQGKVINVPILKNETWTEVSEENPKKNDHPITHKVEKGETIYSISKKYNSDV